MIRDPQLRWIVLQLPEPKTFTCCRTDHPQSDTPASADREGANISPELVGLRAVLVMSYRAAAKHVSN